ncbi:MAG: sulfite exporter TauE/SafE family protein, partial [Methanosarcinaceae archaeon]|nr:sulfite exporter TauE/SafE family protein [Methanosarcinaceae archaeon]
KKSNAKSASLEDKPVAKNRATTKKISNAKGVISVDEPVTKEKATQNKKSDSKNIILVDRPVTKKTSLITKTFKAEGMMCNNCERIITEQVEKLKGVKIIDIDYATEEVVVRYDDNRINFDKIKKAIESKGYICDEDQGPKNTQGWILGILGILIIGYYGFQILEAVELPQLSQNMSYGLLFIVGILTGLHCVSMCGGFVVSYSTKGLKDGKKPHELHLAYGVGKTLSYTMIGAIFGLLGSIIAFTPFMRGMAGILAGLFLLLFGLKMLNIFPSLRKIQLKTPQFISNFTYKQKKVHSNPLVIGLLNGLMIACGPLQAIYIMAAGTGSMIEGAKLLFVFGLGTLPIMLSFGYITSFIGSKATHKLLKFSGAIVIILGLFMINNGLALTGGGYDFQATTNNVPSSIANDKSYFPPIVNGYQEIRMDVTRSGYMPNAFLLKKGVPVKWIINGKDLTGCNNAIQVPAMGLQFDIQKGEQIIEFTPEEAGKIKWSCWMGMIKGSFLVE